MHGRWRIRLLGDLRAERDDLTLTHFRTQKTGALLAYLAFHLDRSHPRPVLMEILWPEEERAATQVKLRMALSALRHQLESSAVTTGRLSSAGAAILANRSAVQLNPAAVTTDVREFEAATRAVSQARGAVERTRLLAAAVQLYTGELLPGYYEPWIVPERQRLAEAFFAAVSQLIAELERAGDRSRALQMAWRAVAMDPLRDEAQHDLIRLLIASGQPEAALHQYEALRQRLDRELGTEPAPGLRALIETLEPRGPGTPVSAAQQQPTGPPLSFPEALAPAGTVTVLLASVEWSGAAEGEPDRGVPAALERLRLLLRAHGGREIGASGHRLETVFGRASDALAAAVAGQRAAGLAPWAARSDEEATQRDADQTNHRSSFLLRMALHTGEVDPKEEMAGSPALQHAARLLLAAHPSQILLSETSAALLQDRLPPGLRLTRLGRYYLCLPAPLERGPRSDDASLTGR